MNLSRLFRGCVFAPAIFLLTSGCGSGGTPLKLTPVSGKITLDGNPMPTGTVIFHPDDSNQKFTPSGIIDNGSYKLLTDGKEGAPVGKYKVSVNPQGMGMGMPTGGAVTTDPSKALGPKTSMNSKFGAPATSGIVIEVVESPASGAYDIKLTK
jgi:hypothetical protein